MEDKQNPPHFEILWKLFEKEPIWNLFFEACENRLANESLWKSARRKKKHVLVFQLLTVLILTCTSSSKRPPNIIRWFESWALSDQPSSAKAPLWKELETLLYCPTRPSTSLLSDPFRSAGNGNEGATALVERLRAHGKENSFTNFDLFRIGLCDSRCAQILTNLQLDPKHRVSHFMNFIIDEVFEPLEQETGAEAHLKLTEWRSAYTAPDRWAGLPESEIRESKPVLQITRDGYTFSHPSYHIESVSTSPLVSSCRVLEPIVIVDSDEEGMTRTGNECPKNEPAQSSFTNEPSVVADGVTSIVHEQDGHELGGNVELEDVAGTRRMGKMKQQVSEILTRDRIGGPDLTGSPIVSAPSVDVMALEGTTSSTTAVLMNQGRKRKMSSCDLDSDTEELDTVVREMVQSAANDIVEKKMQEYFQALAFKSVMDNAIISFLNSRGEECSRALCDGRVMETRSLESAIDDAIAPLLNSRIEAVLRDPGIHRAVDTAISEIWEERLLHAEDEMAISIDDKIVDMFDRRHGGLIKKVKKDVDQVIKEVVKRRVAEVDGRMGLIIDKAIVDKAIGTMLRGKLRRGSEHDLEEDYGTTVKHEKTWRLEERSRVLTPSPSLSYEHSEGRMAMSLPPEGYQEASRTARSPSLFLEDTIPSRSLLARTSADSSSWATWEANMAPIINGFAKYLEKGKREKRRVAVEGGVSGDEEDHVLREK